MTLSILLWSYLIWSDTHKRFCDTKITQHSTAIGHTITPDPCEKLKNGVIFELEDLSHPTSWLVGWLQNSNEILGSAKFLMKQKKQPSEKYGGLKVTYQFRAIGTYGGSSNLNSKDQRLFPPLQSVTRATDHLLVSCLQPQATRQNPRQNIKG